MAIKSRTSIIYSQPDALTDKSCQFLDHLRPSHRPDSRNPSMQHLWPSDSEFTELRRHDVILPASSPVLYTIESKGLWYVGKQAECPVPKSIQDDWDENHRADLENAISARLWCEKKIPEHEMNLEPSLCMAGISCRADSTVFRSQTNVPENPVIIRPALWIYCDNRRVKNTIQSIVHGRQKLNNFLNRHGMGVPHVCRGGPWLAGDGRDDSNPKLVGNKSLTLNVQRPISGSIPGIRISISMDIDSQPFERLSTIGGVVLIRGRPFGLTTAHQLVDCIRHARADKKDDPLDWDTDSDDEEPATSDQGSQGIRYPQAPQSQDISWSSTELPQVLSFNGLATTTGDYSFPQTGTAQDDFALIDLTPLGRVSNTFRCPEDGSWKDITGVMSKDDLVSGSVWIIADSGGELLHGALLKPEASIMVGNCFMRTRKIQVHPTRAAGLSGAWVVRDGSLCGIIFAAYSHSPYLHMIPAEDVFNCISQFLGVRFVHLAPPEMSSDMLEMRPVVAVPKLDPDQETALTSSNTPRLSLAEVDPAKGSILGSQEDISYSETPEVIHKFLQWYKEYASYYKELAKFVCKTCKDFLGKSLYDANVTYRLQYVESLRRLLCDRYQLDQYKTSNDIRRVVDVCSVRIALFVPHHKERVNSFLEKRFKIEEKIDLPKSDRKEQKADNEGMASALDRERSDDKYENRFRGYGATHYHVRLRPEIAGRDFQSIDKIEIQVMSVLQSAWSEVEHNISYKQPSGAPSNAERTMLNGLSGLVSIGELYLEQLNQIYDTRIATEKDQDKPFPHKYELGSFLFSKMEENRVPVDDITMSSVELLRKMLQLDIVGLDSKLKFGEKIDAIEDWESSLHPRHGDSGTLNPSLVVMERLLEDPTLKLEEKAQSYKPESERRRCKILISTIISLDELFSPESVWALELINPYDRDKDELRKHMDNFEWLMLHQAPKNIVLDKSKQVLPSDEYGRKLGSLWNWFQEHPSPLVRFAFTISKLGVLRDFPQELSLLKRVYHASRSYMIAS